MSPSKRPHAELEAQVAALEGAPDFTRLVVDTAPAYFCVVDSEARIVWFNPTLARVTRATDEVRGRHFWDVFATAADAAEMREVLAFAAVAGRAEPQEASFLTAAGARRVVSWSAVAIPDTSGQLRLVLVSGLDLTDQKRHEEELRRLAEEQTALRRVATLVAAGASEVDLVSAATSEIALLFGADTANALRWDGETIRVIGDWSASGDRPSQAGRVYSFGGDTITARVVKSGAPARVDSAEDLETEFGRARWAELGLHASIGAPIVVDGRVWGAITASRTTPDHPFPAGSEHRLGDFAALVAHAIANMEARREVAALAEEQAALRRVATLVAAGRPEREVLDAVTVKVGRLFGAQAVYFVRWEGVQDEVVVVGGWSDGTEPPIPAGSLYHPAPGSATLRVLETGFSSRTDESSPELGPRFVIAAPVIVNARLLGALTALRPGGEAFPAGAEVRLRSFADLVAQSIANAQAQEELRASRARIVRAADEARQKIERNLHDGAQQRLVAVSVSLRVAAGKLPASPEEARALLVAASEELTQALDELRKLARGIHPAILTEQGLGPALVALGERAPLRVAISNELEEERLPPPVEAAVYYVVSESLTNVAKYAQASAVEVRVIRRNGVARVDVVDDGLGGADTSRGSGLRGLADRVEALDGTLGVDSPPAGGTRVWAEIPLG
jgi:PAS domain S-box-containing protein